MSSKIINISLPEELVKEIDRAAKADYASRSDFIRESIVRKLKGQRVIDEWGDPDGEWEPGVDLRNAKGRGMPVEKLLAILEEMTGKRPHDRQNQKISRKT